MKAVFHTAAFLTQASIAMEDTYRALFSALNTSSKGGVTVDMDGTYSDGDSYRYRC